MADRRPPSDEERERTSACRGAHVDCPHLHGSGGGFNLRRLRFEFGQQLCRCPCHAGCPVQYEPNRLAVPREAWHASCTCLGADAARQRLDNSGIEVRDFDQMLEEKRRHRRAGRDAVAATRARAAGRGPERSGRCTPPSCAPGT